MYNNADVGSLTPEGLACSFSLSKVYDKDLKLKVMEEKDLNFKSLKKVCENYKITNSDGSLGLGAEAKKGMQVNMETAPSICWKCKGPHHTIDCRLAKEELICDICEREKGKQWYNHITKAHRTAEQIESSKKELDTKKKKKKKAKKAKTANTQGATQGVTATQGATQGASATPKAVKTNSKELHDLIA